jgi:hypothetical protein
MNHALQTDERSALVAGQPIRPEKADRPAHS